MRKIKKLPSTLIMHRVAVSLLVLFPTLFANPSSSHASSSPQWVKGEIIVGYKHTNPAERVRTAAVSSSVIKISRADDLKTKLKQLRSRPDVAYAAPNLIAHATGTWSPNDPGIGKTAGAWSNTQWNFNKVGAQQAWFNLQAANHPGGQGVKIAVLDSGIAYRDWGKFKRSPDFNTTIFSDPWDFVANNAYPLDREGHGTFSAGVIAESTNNNLYMSGLAWGATIMPVRVLDANGDGSALAIEKGIRWAADHGAKVINMSLAFPPGTSIRSIPGIISGIDYATNKGALVVAAAGNEHVNKVDYPAAYPKVLSVGATTERDCLADYSNWGTGLDLVAPGGGDDSAITGDSRCNTKIWNSRLITQIGLDQSSSGSVLVPYRFVLLQEAGTSFAAPHVAAAAALLVASGKLGANPTPANITARLLSTAKPTPVIMQGGKDHSRDYYGAGTLDVGRATNPLIP